MPLLDELVHGAHHVLSGDPVQAGGAGHRADEGPGVRARRRLVAEQDDGDAVGRPAFGGDHLVEWASSVVAVVTAGKSTAERIHAVGEMIRLAGVTQVSGVLVGSDKSDESLGLAGSEGAGPRTLAADNLAADADSLFGAVSGIRSATPFPARRSTGDAR